MFSLIGGQFLCVNNSLKICIFFFYSYFSRFLPFIESLSFSPFISSKKKKRCETYELTCSRSNELRWIIFLPFAVIFEPLLYLRAVARGSPVPTDMIAANDIVEPFLLHWSNSYNAINNTLNSINKIALFRFFHYFKNGNEYLWAA